MALDLARETSVRYLMSIQTKEKDSDTVLEDALIEGVPIHPGIVVARLVTSQESVENCRSLGTPYVLALNDDSVDDFRSLSEAEGFLSLDPSANSWCAVQAKSEGIPTIIGLKGKLSLEGITAADEEELNVPGTLLIPDGCDITMDAYTGQVWYGAKKIDRPVYPALFRALADLLIERGCGVSGSTVVLSDNLSKPARNAFEILANIDTAASFNKTFGRDKVVGPTPAGTVHTEQGALIAELLGSKLHWDAESSALSIEPRADRHGIGLLRTERLFIDRSELDALRKALIYPFFKDRISIERVGEELGSFLERRYTALMEQSQNQGLTVVRSLCMPNNKVFGSDFDASALAVSTGIELERLQSILADKFAEKETFHGLRGTRFHLLNRDAMRIEFAAFMRSVIRQNHRRECVLLLSMVTFPEEVRQIQNDLVPLADACERESGERPRFRLAIMVETTAAYVELSRFMQCTHEEFPLTGFFFGGNDFTAAVLNMNRSDSVRHLIPSYRQLGLLKHDPFIRLNPTVIKAISTGVKTIRNGLGEEALIGFGGEQAADVVSVRNLDQASDGGIDFFSTSPDRIIEHLTESGDSE